MDPDDDSATVFLDHFGLGPEGAITLLPPTEPDDDLPFPDEDTDVLFDHLDLSAADADALDDPDGLPDDLD